jgi:hypothetical protein
VRKKKVRERMRKLDMLSERERREKGKRECSQLGRQIV